MVLPLDATLLAALTLRTLRLTRSTGRIYELKDTERAGLLSLYDYAHFFATFLKSEAERQFLVYTYLGDLVKGTYLY